MEDAVEEVQSALDELLRLVAQHLLHRRVHVEIGLVLRIDDGLHVQGEVGHALDIVVGPVQGIVRFLGPRRQPAEEEESKRGFDQDRGQWIQLFEPVGYQIAERIRALDIDNLKPLEALRILNDLKEELKRQ